MAKARLEARSTGYKGILFRSKSEAIFARCMDLYSESHPTDKLYWEYEPQVECAGVSKGLFDFYISIVTSGKFSTAQAFYFEYKPSEPTKAYKDEFALKAIGLTSQFSSCPKELRPAVMIAWINFFDDKKKRGGTGWGPVSVVNTVYATMTGIVQHIEEAKKYRYDLEA